MPAVLVVRPGLYTTVQDLGRWGYQASGVSVSGAMDRGAHRRANALVGNPPWVATLEVTLVGPELVFEDDCTSAVSGAEFALEIDGKQAAMHETLRIRGGSRLRFGARIAGARAYLAVGGGFDVPVVLGSRSTHVASAIGGFMGRALLAGDRVPTGRVPPSGVSPGGGAVPHRSVAVPHGNQREPRQPDAIRVLPGPELERFGDAGFAALLAQPFVVANDSNRMGFRLNGAQVGSRGAANMLSEATPLGAIQIPPSGQPVLLMADRPTTGGYPAIAHVIAADIDAAAQLAPGDTVRFASCSMADAFASAFAREAFLRSFEGRS